MLIDYLQEKKEKKVVGIKKVKRNVNMGGNKSHFFK